MNDYITTPFGEQCSDELIILRRTYFNRGELSETPDQFWDALYKDCKANIEVSAAVSEQWRSKKYDGGYAAMIRQIKLILANSIVLFCGSIAVSPAIAQTNTASTKYFSARVVNIRRAATGKTLVTVQFTATVPEEGAVTLYTNNEECRKSGTLIDGGGNEYGTLRCMTYAYRGNGGYITSIGGGQGMFIKGGSSSAFVYEFSTPISSSVTSDTNINIIIPIIYEVCPTDQPAYISQRCLNSTTSLSFFDLSVK